MKDIVRNLLEVAMNAEDYTTKEELETIVRDLVDTFEMTINCPYPWREIKEELIEEYSNDNDALSILQW